MNLTPLCENLTSHTGLWCLSLIFYQLLKVRVSLTSPTFPKCWQVGQIAAVILLLGGFRVEGHNNHITTSVERKEITVINCPQRSSSGLADCFLYYFFLTNWLETNLALLRQSAIESCICCLLRFCTRGQNRDAYSENDSLVRIVFEAMSMMSLLDGLKWSLWQSGWSNMQQSAIRVRLV